MDRPLFSEMLSERRRELGYSIGQASRVLRLREDVLVAFEEGNFEGMPKSGYAQGMLSSYARYLGLDAAVVVDAYQDELKAYVRGSRRGGSQRGSGSGSRSRRNANEQELRQPRVPSRGLLPTSGGYAGDLGSFATTRVRTRAADGDDAQQTYPQGRPYTARTPNGGVGGSRASRRGTSDIGTLRMDYSQYDDDLNTQRDMLPYDAASSQRGRRRTGEGRSAQRPRVSRRGSSTAGRTGASRSHRSSRQDRSRNKGLMGLLGSTNIGLVAVGVVLILLSIIMVISVSSCINQSGERGKSVPVSTSEDTQTSISQSNATSHATSSEAAHTGTSNQTSNGTHAESTNAATMGTVNATDANGTKASYAQVSVSVSVADGAVTWLEINCDGKSDVAETVTGPWQHTYVVKESISIQAGDTTSVSVVQDGRQVQFDSMASGIGTIRIQNPNYTVQQKKLVNTQDNETEESTSGSAKMGNAAPTNTTDAMSQTESVDSKSYYDGYSDYSESYDESYYGEYEGW